MPSFLQQTSPILQCFQEQISSWFLCAEGLYVWSCIGGFLTWTLTLISNVPRQYFPGEECPKETVHLASRPRLGRPNSLVWTISWEIWISSRWCGRKSRCMEKCTCFFSMLFSLLAFHLVLNVQVWCNVSQHSTGDVTVGFFPQGLSLLLDPVSDWLICRRIQDYII